MADQTESTNVTSDQTENGQGQLTEEDPDTGEDMQVPRVFIFFMSTWYAQTVAIFPYNYV